MWKSVPRGEWPFWALDMHSLWRHPTGHWLANTVSSTRSLWELFTPDAKVITNQMDLHFGQPLDGAPEAWANKELSNRGVSLDAPT